MFENNLNNFSVRSTLKDIGHDDKESSQQTISKEKEEYKRNINLQHQLNDCGVTKLNDLNLATLGQDKKIVDLVQGEQVATNDTPLLENVESLSLPNSEATLSSNVSRHADHIRGKLSNLFGRHNPQGSGVNRALFLSEEEDSKHLGEKTTENRDRTNVNRCSEPRSFVSEESSEYSGYAIRSSPSKSRSQSVESDEGMVMFDPLSTDTSPNKQIKPMPTLHETADNISQQHTRFLSPTSQTGSSMHKVASSSSMCVPVTENDPLGALSAANSPTKSQATSPSRLSNATGLTKSATCPSQSLSQVGHHGSQLTEEIKSNAINQNQNVAGSGTVDENILGSPFANQNNMTRSTTMPVSEQSGTASTPAGRWQMGKSKLSSLRKSYFSPAISSLSPSTVTKVKTQDVLNTGFSKIQSAYSNAATSLSKRVEELKEYQQQNSQGPPLSYPGLKRYFVILLC